jgi:hypothetical protein
MGKSRRYTGNLKTIVLAGVMALVTVNVVAQQEVDPERFEHNQTVTAPKHAVSKTRKPTATAVNTNAASNQHVRQAKATKNTGTPRVVTVAAH